MRSNELTRLAREITRDNISDPADLETVTKLAVSTLQLDPRIFVKLGGERKLWVCHKKACNMTFEKSRSRLVRLPK